MPREHWDWLTAAMERAWPIYQEAQVDKILKYHDGRPGGPRDYRSFERIRDIFVQASTKLDKITEKTKLAQAELAFWVGAPYREAYFTTMLRYWIDAAHERANAYRWEARDDPRDLEPLRQVFSVLKETWESVPNHRWRPRFENHDETGKRKPSNTQGWLFYAVVLHFASWLDPGERLPFPTPTNCEAVRVHFRQGRKLRAQEGPD